MTSARSAFQTFLQYGDGGTPESFTTVVEITNITTPEKTVTMQDATHAQSPGGYEEFIATTKNAGEPSVDYSWIPGETSHDAIDAAMDGAARNWVVSFPDFGRGTHVSTVVAETNVWTHASHGFYTGQPVRISTAGTLPTSTPQVDLLTTYFVGVEGENTFKLYAANADAVAGEGEIDFTNTGTGDQVINTGTLAKFAGLVSGLSTPAEVKGKLTGRAKIKATGPLVFSG